MTPKRGGKPPGGTRNGWRFRTAALGRDDLRTTMNVNIYHLDSSIKVAQLLVNVTLQLSQPPPEAGLPVLPV
ncbi:hypothetical protein, partial [Halomonas sp. S2151]|uniref:hypothetical protein n=1 Tax=Halomonas sp. S2151 TaxID=579478 RepID=UPI001950A886